MANIEKHPAPEKILQQITAEAINGLELGGQVDHPSIKKMETAVGLIAKAWGLPQEIHQASVDLIQKEKELVRSGSHEAALPDSELLETYDGPMTAELLWGLFETAVKLEDAQDRAAIHELAIMTADNLSLDEWIEACGPAKGQN